MLVFAEFHIGYTTDFIVQYITIENPRNAATPFEHFQVYSSLDIILLYKARASHKL